MVVLYVCGTAGEYVGRNRFTSGCGSVFDSEVSVI